MSDNTEPGQAAARFWNHSVALYGKAGVEAACLALQDDCGLDVNILLFCCWTAAEGAPALGEDRLARAIDAQRSWRQRAIAPLRAVRRDLKSPVANLDETSREAFRQQVAAIEREAERIAQGLLVAAVPCAADAGRAAQQGLATAAANLVDYAALTCTDPATARHVGLGVILSAAFDVSAERAGQAIQASLRSRTSGCRAL